LTNFKIIILISILLIISGCASRSDLKKRANVHAKAGSYYQSIGQNGAATEEYKSAAKNQKDAHKPIQILVDLFNFFINK